MKVTITVLVALTALVAVSEAQRNFGGLFARLRNRQGNGGSSNTGTVNNDGWNTGARNGGNNRRWGNNNNNNNRRGNRQERMDEAIDSLPESCQPHARQVAQCVQDEMPNQNTARTAMMGCVRDSQCDVRQIMTIMRGSGGRRGGDSSEEGQVNTCVNSALGAEDLTMPTRKVVKQYIQDCAGDDAKLLEMAGNKLGKVMKMAKKIKENEDELVEACGGDAREFEKLFTCVKGAMNMEETKNKICSTCFNERPPQACVNDLAERKDNVCNCIDEVKDAIDEDGCDVDERMEKLEEKTDKFCNQNGVPMRPRMCDRNIDDFDLEIDLD